MAEPEIRLTNEERRALADISRCLGHTEEYLVHAALSQFITRYHGRDRRSLLEKAKGIWKDRDDIPSLEELRSDWNRPKP